MRVKAFEVRDSCTFIPVLAILMHPSAADYEAERYLLRRAGFTIAPAPFIPDGAYPEKPYAVGESIVLVRMECSGINNNATYDPYSWPVNGTRTLAVAHEYIWKHWEDLKSGDVIDVEFILGETKEPKRSEKDGDHYE